MSGSFFLHMSFAGTMTTLAINSGSNLFIFVFRPLHHLRIAIVTAHALQFNLAFEAAVSAIFKARGKIPCVLLRVECHGHLRQVAVCIHNMRIGMLPGSYY